MHGFWKCHHRDYLHSCGQKRNARILVPKVAFLMRLVDIFQVKRVNDVFYLNGHRIPADRKASDGYGVLIIFEPSKLDKDFQPVLGFNNFCWFPTAQQLKAIVDQLDLSDRLTCDWLRKGSGWTSGPRPFSHKETRVADFL